MNPRIIYIQYTNPGAYPPLEHSSHILADANFEVLFLGTGGVGAGALTLRGHERITVRQMFFTPAGWRQKLHYFAFSLWVGWWMLHWRPQWVYASDYLSCPVALVLSYWPGLNVLYHEHDSPMSSVSGSLFQRLCLAARRRLARRAQLNILPNERRAKLFADEVGATENVLCVWNCPSIEEVGPVRAERRAEELLVLYHGSVVPSRLPRTVLKALALLPPEVKLRVIGYETIGHRGYVDELKLTARACGVEARVEFVEALPRYELMRWCQESDVGLAFMPKNSEDLNEQSMVGASNKPFDYLSCGLALLVCDLPDWLATFTEAGYGLACDIESPASIAAALEWFLKHPRETRLMGEAGRNKVIGNWNYEDRFAPVKESIFQALPAALRGGAKSRLLN